MSEIAKKRGANEASSRSVLGHREIPSAYLILTNESVDIWCAAITKHRKVIGRKQSCEIIIPPKFVSVSRRHAEIWGDSDGIQLRDLKSTAGTRINGVSIKANQDTEAVIGDRIMLGILELQIVNDLPVQRQLFAETGVLIDESMDSVDPSRLSPTPPRTLLANLTKAEFAIVLWICRGFYKDEEIGHYLHRSPNTIRTQVNSIFRKLNVHSRTDLVRLIKYPPSEGNGEVVTVVK